jgi:hypothetical protein
MPPKTNVKNDKVKQKPIRAKSNVTRRQLLMGATAGKTAQKGEKEYYGHQIVAISQHCRSSLHNLQSWASPYITAVSPTINL